MVSCLDLKECIMFTSIQTFSFHCLALCYGIKGKEKEVKLQTAVEGSGCHWFIYVWYIAARLKQLSNKQTAMLRQYQGLVHLV